MKIAIITDQHFGARKNSKLFHDYFLEFYENVFFPTLEKEGITTVIDMGDTFDSRKGIDFAALTWAKNHYFDRLKSMGITVHTIVGNHTAYYKNTNDINAVDLLLREYDNVKIYAETQEVKLGDTKVLFVPWINNENEEETFKKIKKSDCKVVMGHLELNGFQATAGHYMEHGMETTPFDRFEKVYSGHYHRKSDNGTIFYLGTQYEITWSDYQCPKGFHIFDTDTRELTRIPNPINMFKKIIYNDKTNSYSNMDISEYEDCFVKVIVEEKTDVNQFGDFIDRLHNDIHTNEVNVIEDSYNINSTADVNIVDQGEDTLSFLQNYINSLDTELDKNKMNSIVKDLYSEVQDK